MLKNNAYLYHTPYVSGKIYLFTSCHSILRAMFDGNFFYPQTSAALEVTFSCNKTRSKTLSQAIYYRGTQSFISSQAGHRGKDKIQKSLLK